MKNIVIIFLFLFSLIACEENNNDKYTNMCNGQAFIFLNSNGEDLFNNNTPNYIDTTDFKVYTPEGNKLNFYFYPNNYEGKSELDVGIWGEEEKEGTTYLKFGDYAMDTIYAKFKEKGAAIFISELYYNNKLIVKTDSSWMCNTTVQEITVKPDWE